MIDKPAGLTSHDVVARVRRILKTKRVGHTGTLDPFATGVLVLMIGNATRLTQFLDKDEKEYEAVVRFGFETDTGDGTGVRRAESGMPSEEIFKTLKKTDWNEMLKQFRGEIDQMPPMYSAKKINGKKLYELARQGIEIERRPSKVVIHKLEILKDSAVYTSPTTLGFRVVCSAGTYVRTLAEDIGKKLGTGAHLTELRRTRAGKFGISDSLTLDELQKLDTPSTALLPVTLAVEHLPSVALSDERVAKTRSGLSTRTTDDHFLPGEPVTMNDENGELIAVGYYNEAEKTIRPKIVLV